MEYAQRILQIFLTAFNTVVQIAQGVIGPAATMLETGLRMILPIVIGFLANYAGLGGISNRIRDIIGGIRERVDAAILWLIDRGISALQGLLNMIQSGVSAVADWWRLRKTFTTSDGQTHSVYFAGSEQDPRVMMATTPDDVQDHITARRNNTAVPLTTAQEQSLTDAEETLLQIRRLTRPGGRARAETESIRPQIDTLLTTR
jgi:hypothetical protein